MAAWAYPFVGVVVAGLAMGVGWLGVMAGLPDLTNGLLIVAVLAITTGAMHEDGLADSADGLWGGWNIERRLDIMKDSRIGAYGVLALIISLGLRAGLYGAVLVDHLWAIIAIAALSRAAMVGVMWALPHARQGGLSVQVGRVKWQTVLITAAVVGGICAALNVWLIVPFVVLSMLVCMGIAHAKIKGQTGDILGATQQVAEISALLALFIIY